MLIELTLLGRPITKKNHTRRTRSGKQIQSEAFLRYAEDCLWQIPANIRLGIDSKCNIKCVYYMTIDYYKIGSKAKVDLVGLLQGTLDILADANVIQDDNCRIAAKYDGSEVRYDKENPRVEIEIEVID